MKKSILALAIGVAGGYVIAKHGKEIIEKVKASTNNESFEQLLKELEKHKANLFKKEEVATDEYEEDEENIDVGYVFNPSSDKEGNSDEKFPNDEDLSEED